MSRIRRIRLSEIASRSFRGGSSSHGDRVSQEKTTILMFGDLFFFLSRKCFLTRSSLRIASGKASGCFQQEMRDESAEVITEGTGGFRQLAKLGHGKLLRKQLETHRVHNKERSPGSFARGLFACFPECSAAPKYGVREAASL